MSNYHPWRALRGLADWTLVIAALPPGLLGLTDHASRTILLAEGQTQRQRRCTIAHEIAHVERGPIPREHTVREEREVDQLTARRLIPFERLMDACRWARNLHELADELWVDEETVTTRLAHLHPSERLKLREVLHDRQD
jgi:hypothetical protein